MAIRRLLARTRDHVIASDPAFSRLRAASRALLSLLISAALLAALHFAVHPLPPAGFGLAVVVALTGSMMIRDASAKGQLVTRVYAAIGAVASVATASLLSPWPAAAYAGFLVVIFAAVYVRRFGQRWFGVGMLAFMAFFMGDYLRPKAADLPWVALAALLAFAVAQVVATVLLRDEPERDFRRALVTIDRRIDLILTELREHAGAPDIAEDERQPLRDQLARLREAVLMAEGFIPQGEGGALAGEGAASDLAVALFELQLFVERVVVAAFSGVPASPAIEAVRDRNDAALARLLDNPQQQVSPGVAAAGLLRRLIATRARLDRELGPAPSPAFAGAPEIAVPISRGGGAAAASGGGFPENLKLPIQVTAASAIALACGLLLSPSRWYWAVITAFIVFNNTQSRSDTAVRAAQRSAGTLGGLVAGSLAATLLAGHTYISLAGILLLFFVGFYFVQVSYAVMIFCITVALALIYGVMGMFTPELLVLRLEETLIGAAAGTGVAFFVFANRTTSAAEAKLDSYFDALVALLDAAKRRIAGDEREMDLMALSRAVDRAYGDLATVVRPMGGPWKTVTRFGAVREKLLLLTGCVHWARSLARGLAGHPPPAPEMRPRLEAVSEEIAERLAAARARGVALFHRSRRGSAGDQASRRQPLPVSQEATPAFSLEMIAALLQRLVA